jgi:hypothetical protein
MACGVGYNDDTQVGCGLAGYTAFVRRAAFTGEFLQVPWSTRWFGKNAKSGGWFNNFRIPFQKSINVTFRAGPNQNDDVIYMVRRLL